MKITKEKLQKSDHVPQMWTKRSLWDLFGEVDRSGSYYNY